MVLCFVLLAIDDDSDDDGGGSEAEGSGGEESQGEPDAPGSTQLDEAATPMGEEEEDVEVVNYDAEGYGSDDCHLGAGNDDGAYDDDMMPSAAAAACATPIDSLQNMPTTDDTDTSTHPGSASPGHWSCQYCTYDNAVNRRKCAICGERRGSPS